MKRIVDYFRGENGDHFTVGFGVAMCLSSFAFTSAFWFLLGLAFVFVGYMTIVARRIPEKVDYERED